MDHIDHFFSKVFLFHGIPLPIILLLMLAVYLIFYLGPINFTFIPLSFKNVFSKISNSGSGSKNEISGFEAFCSQAASNLGIGNISGSVFALYYGGPGSVFWVPFFGILLSIVKFAEITFSKLYRTVGKDGFVFSGPSYMIKNGIIDKTNNVLFKSFWYILATFSAVALFISTCTWSGFQLNQILDITFHAIPSTFNALGQDKFFLYGAIVLSFFIFFVLVGGISRIASVTVKMVPLMTIIYFSITLFVVILKWKNFIPSVNLIYDYAFNLKAAGSGLVITIISSVKRMVFASEAGLGTSQFSHANSNADYPARQGLMAIFDSIIISFVLALGMLCILVSGIDYKGDVVGVALMFNVFSDVSSLMAYLLCLVIFLFGFTSLVGNGYYAKQSIAFLLNNKNYNVATTFIYAIITLFISIKGSILILNYADAIAVALFIPNVLAIFILSPVLKEEVKKFKQAI